MKNLSVQSEQRGEFLWIIQMIQSRMVFMMHQRKFLQDISSVQRVKGASVEKQQTGILNFVQSRPRKIDSKAHLDHDQDPQPTPNQSIKLGRHTRPQVESVKNRLFRAIKLQREPFLILLWLLAGHWRRCHPLMENVSTLTVQYHLHAEQPLVCLLCQMLLQVE